MSVKQLVDDAIAANKITIFSKSYCPYCKRVKSLFATEYPEEATAIYELDERADGDAIQVYLYEKTGQRTVPNVFVSTKHIGGNDDTQAAQKKGELRTLIKA